ncbi:MAG: BspA family leucine-rich repeat surface protein, partial [Lachnospiraceae bacterium]|nr:BspA family leucine-rich repeat surface protein [Lachnospiraceae bacterium]
MKKMLMYLLISLMGAGLMWTCNVTPVQAEESMVYVNSSLPTKEEWATWEADGTLQQRIDFMNSVQEGQTAEGLIGKWNQQSVYSLHAPEFWHGGMPTEGNVKALVFMVEFADMKNTDSNVTPEYMQELFFGEQNAEASMYPYESLKAYYQRSSYDKLNISGDVYGWYTLSGNRSDYEDDWEGRERLIRELLDAHDEQIDFSDYDMDKDGNLDAIYIYYAGGNTGWGTQWWSYMSNTATEISYDETAVCKYVFLGDPDSVTAIHETGHLLGLPDYYNASGLTSVNEKGGIGISDMMDHNVGDHNIFSKMLLGWVEPQIVTETEEINLELLSSDKAKAVIIAKEDISSIFDEYFILELYDNSGNNVHLPYRSVQSPQTDTPLIKIYHVDATLNEAGNDFAYNNVDTEHKLIKLLESDGKEMSGLTDCEVVSSKFYDEGMSLGPDTMPSSEWYNGVYSGVEIKVKDIKDSNASVQITTGVEDTQGPDVQEEPFQAVGSVFNVVPIEANAVRILFDCYIYRDADFDNISMVNNTTGENVGIQYDILNPRGNYPETINRYNIIEMIITDDLTYGTDYTVTIPANAVKDAAKNGNKEIKITLKTAPQHKNYTITEELELDILPANAPEGVETVPGYSKEVYYMDNGNIVIVYILTNSHGGVMVLGPDKTLISNTYSDAELLGGSFHPLGEEHYLLRGSYGYMILHQDGTVVKQGAYKESGYADANSLSNSIVIRENCIDIRVSSSECVTSQLGYFVCRVSEGVEVTYLYPDIYGSELADYNETYTYRCNLTPDQYIEFAKVNQQKDTQIYHHTRLIENGTDIRAYSNLYHMSSAWGWTNVWDSHGLLEICDDSNRRRMDCNIGYGYSIYGDADIKSVGDGYVVLSTVMSMQSSPTLTGSTNGYWFHWEGMQVTRLDEQFNVLWTTYVPNDEANNNAGNPFKIGDTIYLSQGDKLLAINDVVSSPWVSADKTFSIANSVGTVNERKQMIVIAPGTTVQNIADKVQGNYGSITFYDPDYKKVTDWSEVIHNGIMCITSVDGFYKYYYQITDVAEITFSTDYVEVDCYCSEDIAYNHTSAHMIAASEDKNFLYVESTNGGIADGHIFTDSDRIMHISTSEFGEAALTVKNVFGDAEAECIVKVGGVVMVKQPVSQAVELGKTAVFTVEAEGSGLRYQWQFKKSDSDEWKNSGMAGSNTNSISVVGTEARNGYQYRCVITGEKGTQIVSEPAELTIVTESISGSLGDNGGIAWEYDSTEATLTLSGEDGGIGELNQSFAEAEKVCILDSKITGSMARMFADMEQLKYVEFRDVDTSEVTDMHEMFAGCSALEEVSLGNLDTANVTTMSRMFASCGKLNAIDISGFELSSMEDMDWMFAGCTGLANLDLSSLDISDVTYVENMLKYCQGLNVLKTPKAMSESQSLRLPGVFYDDGGLKYATFTADACEKSLLRPVELLDVGLIGENYGFFWDYRRDSKELYLSGEDTKIDNMAEAFPEAERIYIMDSKITESMARMFADMKQLKCVEFLNVDTSGVTDMQDMFAGCSELESVSLGGLDTAKVTTMCRMFTSCGTLNAIDISGFDLSSMEDMDWMFAGCTGLTNLDLSSLDISNVTHVENMLKYCQGLKVLKTPKAMSESQCLRLPGVFYDDGGLKYATCTADACEKSFLRPVELLDVGLTGEHYGFFWDYRRDSKELYLSGEDTQIENMAEAFPQAERIYIMDSKITESMARMFADMKQLKYVEFLNVDTSGVTDMHEMFAGCRELEEVSLGGLDTSNVTTTRYMFASCQKLTSLNLESFNTPKLEDMEGMFMVCQALKQLDMRNFDTRNVVYMDNVLQHCYELEELMTPKAMSAGQSIALATSLKDFSGREVTELTSEVCGTILKKNVVLPITIIQQPVSLSVNEGTDAIFSIVANGEELKYQWQFRKSAEANWANSGMAGSNTAGITVVATKARNGYQYRCVVTDGRGNQVISDGATLSVQTVGVAITVQSESKTVAVGENAAFTITASGSGLKYQWQFRKSSEEAWVNSGMAGTNTNSITVVATKARDGYQYRCVVTDANGNKVTSNGATLSIRTASVTITGQPESKTVTVGENATFTVTVSGSNLRYQWQLKKPGIDGWVDSGMTGATTSSITVQGTKARDGYQYRCVVTDASGNKVTSNGATLSVQTAGVTITG